MNKRLVPLIDSLLDKVLEFLFFHLAVAVSSNNVVFAWPMTMTDWFSSVTSYDSELFSAMAMVSLG
jgi:hypothetical protein